MIILYYIHRRKCDTREHSSAGRASALQAEGHRFEPCCSHHYQSRAICFGHNGPVVQLVRTPACHAGGRRFEPVSGRHFADMAQVVERVLGKDEVGGSSPPISSKKIQSALCRLYFFNTNQRLEPPTLYSYMLKLFIKTGHLFRCPKNISYSHIKTP